MDDRQTKIREGAGLEDSRVNQDFVDFLNKWSSPVLLTLAVAALIWAGMQYLDRKKAQRIDQAFSELEAATSGGNPSPASLKTLASEYKGVRSVPELALLYTSDLYLEAFVTGIEPGAEIDPQTGQPINESDILDQSQRDAYRDQAGQLAQQVLDLTQGKPGKALIAMQAMTRLASVDEGKRDFDAARSMYERVKSTATESQYPTIVAFAQERLDNLDALKNTTALPDSDQLAPLPGEDQPELTQEQIQQILNAAVDTDPTATGDREPDPADDADPADPADQTPAPAPDQPAAGQTPPSGSP